MYEYRYEVVAGQLNDTVGSMHHLIYTDTGHPCICRVALVCFGTRCHLSATTWWVGGGFTWRCLGINCDGRGSRHTMYHVSWPSVTTLFRNTMSRACLMCNSWHINIYTYVQHTAAYTVDFSAWAYPTLPESDSKKSETGRAGADASPIVYLHLVALRDLGLGKIYMTNSP